MTLYKFENGCFEGSIFSLYFRIRPNDSKSLKERQVLTAIIALNNPKIADKQLLTRLYTVGTLNATSKTIPTY